MVRYRKITKGGIRGDVEMDLAALLSFGIRAVELLLAVHERSNPIAW